MTAKRRTRLGWLGPIIVLVAAAIAGLAAWAVVVGKPTPGAEIDRIPIDARTTFVVRAEQDGGRNFIELIEGDKLVWSALVPHYAGRPGAPGIAWNNVAVSVRVLRDNRAEIFALSLHDATKIGGFRLAPNHGEVIKQKAGPVTLTDHVRSYEIVGGADWHQLVTIDLSTGEALWVQELGPIPVDAGAVEAGTVWVRQGGLKRAFRVADGVEQPSASSS